MTSVTKEKRHLNPRLDPFAPFLHVDFVLILSTMALSLLGMVMVYSATRGRDLDNLNTELRDKQAIFLALGVGVLAVTSIIDYRQVYNAVWAIYGACMLLLVVVLIPGIGQTDINDVARSWFFIGGFSIQPAEFAKAGTILALAWWLSRFDGDIGLAQMGVALAIGGTPMLLIREQPDVGTTLVFGVIVAVMLLAGGAALHHLLGLTVLAIGGGALAIRSLGDFQRDRLTVFLEPGAECAQEACYNVNQSQIAIGNGGLTGSGWGLGTQTNSDFVPEQHTDFIFTVIGEELGFVGGVITIALFAVVVFRTYRTAMIAGDSFGSLICVGVLGMLVFQIFQSMGMTMGIMPVTGIPLPLVSYGGSSALTTFASLGLVLSVHMRRYQAAIDSR